ncbi:RNA-directed DNA polymerase from mobile element jockey-like [Brachionus plicatilis]|uniref:RNA-directed DNA polymerase from mobile element jockey-like n=1 Tax=Brachionus plicatilis TaxID=10195 RepID=A0A3M7R8T4_BRAPC|nr:RNA-directed DNA polymerase from mobile element jockey-like [Brachionus plicatilis]
MQWDRWYWSEILSNSTLLKTILYRYKLYSTQPKNNQKILINGKSIALDNSRIFQIYSRVTKLVSRYKNWSYADRLAVLGLTTLEEHRVRGDMIQLFKFYRGFNAVCWVKPMKHCNSLSQAGPAGNIRGHRRRLSGQVTTKCQQRANFFTNRVINEWNALQLYLFM